MTSLRDLAHAAPWSLPDFVETLNDLLPAYLPADPSNTRVREEMTPRLVRYYTSKGLLAEPGREGREARYGYRHLLQALVVRRLLSEGLSGSAIDDLAKTKTVEELEEILEGGVQVTVAPANPALAYLDTLKRRANTPDVAPERAVPASGSVFRTSSPSSPDPPEPARWSRLEVTPGFELHVRDDFRVPKTPQEQQNLQQLLTQALESLQKRRPK